MAQWIERHYSNLRNQLPFPIKFFNFFNSGVAKTSNYPLTDSRLPSAAGQVGRGSLKSSNPLPPETIEKATGEAGQTYQTP